MLDLGSAVGYLLLDTKGFSSGFTSALQSVRTMQSESATTADKFTAMGTAMTAVGGRLTRSLTLPLVGLGTAAVHTAANFESAMSQVQATTGYADDTMVKLNGSTVNALDSLSDLAQEMGATTKFSASEAAAAINNMAMAGYEVQEIYDALPGVLNLASAGALDLDYATQLVANGLNVMGMETSDVNELADKMAVTATKAYGSVSDFGEGLLIAGAQAKLANVSLTDTFTALGILGDNGISASEGGTYLRNTLKNLYTPTDDAAKALNELGVETAESDGQLRDFQEVLQDLGGALDGLTEEQRITYMSRIFDTRTISAANALIANSTQRWDELSESIDNAAGSAEQMKEAQLNNLTGQLTILKSSIEGAAIAFGNVLLPVIKQLASAFQGLMNWLNGLDESQKKTLVTILEVVAAIGPLLVIFGKLSTAIGAVIGLFSGTGGLAAAFTLLTGPLGLVIAAVGALVAAWVTDFHGIREFTADIVGKIRDTVREFLEALLDNWDTCMAEIKDIGEQVFTALQKIVQTAMTVIRNIWDNDLYSIRTSATNIWNSIKSIFNTVLSAIQQIFAIFSAAFRGDWDAVWTGIKELASTIWNGILTEIGNILNSIVDLLVGIAALLYEAALRAWNKYGDAVKEFWNQFMGWLRGAVEDPVGTILSIGDSLFNAGKSIISSLWDGVKATWDSVAGWFTEKVAWIKSIFASARSAVSESASGSYASGLDYVTHDRVVQVHEGEAILTKEENRERLNGNRSNGGDTYNFYSPKALNPTTAAREMRKAKQQLALGLT